MIKVIVELHSAVTGDVTRLGEARIGNDGTGDQSTGNYRAAFWGKRNRHLRGVEVKGFPRRQLLAWDLLYRCLQQAFGARNQTDVRVKQLENAVRWALGENGTFPEEPPAKVLGGQVVRQRYYWRSELRRRAGL